MNDFSSPVNSLLPQESAETSAARPASIGTVKLLMKPPWVIVVLAWMIRLSVGLNLYASLLHQRSSFVDLLGTWIPFEITQGQYLRMFMVAILLFTLADGLVRGKQTAWILTIAVLALSPLLHLGRTDIWPHEFINFILIGLLVIHQDYFVAKSDQVSVLWALIICPVLVFALLVFGSIRLHDLRDETSGDDDWFACMQTASELVLVHNTDTQTADTRLTARFFYLLQIGGTSIALLGLYLVLRPVLLRRISRSEHREKVRHLIDLYGTDPLDPYALLPDKNYFISGDGRSAIAYVLSGNLAVTLADPIGHPLHRSTAIAEFAQYCRQQDWEPVFYEVSTDLMAHYEEAGFAIFKIGEEARLQTEAFHLRGNAFQNLRTARNRARKLGIRFYWYRPGHQVDETLEVQLEEVSKTWLKAKNAREMSFDMGVYNLEDLRQNGAAVAIDAGGKAVAFATWRPFAQGTGRTLDLMRSLPNESSIMDFVLVESILHLRAQGIENISLGNAPLANVDGARPGLAAEEKVVQFLFENMNRLYHYKSLFEFKRKYRPQWLGRYVVYRRGVALPLIGLALVRVHAREGLWKFLVG